MSKFLHDGHCCSNSKFLSFIKVSTRVRTTVQLYRGSRSSSKRKFWHRRTQEDKRGCLVRVCARKWYLLCPFEAKVGTGPCNLMTWQCLTPEYGLTVTFFHTLTRQRVPSWKFCRGPKAKFGQLPFPELGTSLGDLQLWPLRSTWIGLVIYWAIPSETLPYTYIRKKVFQNKTKTHKTRL